MASQKASVSLVRSAIRPGRSNIASINSSFRTPRRLYRNNSQPKTTFGRSFKTGAFAIAASAVTFAVVTTGAAILAEAAPDEPNEPVIEKTKKKKGASKERNRDLISSQHLQVRRSWENPGVYAWGSNTGGVVAPGSNESQVKSARRIPWFNDKLLRDIKLDRMFGAAVLENGDLVEWGKGYSDDSIEPQVILSGMNIKQIEISRDRIIALTKSGEVLSIPAARSEQEQGPKVTISSWIPGMSSTAPISYRVLRPTNKEPVTAISSGLEHLLMIGKSGTLYSAASGTDDFPQRGQLGVPGLTWHTRPPGAYDQPHEITTLKGFEIASIASGDHHSLALDREGRVFSFGDNSCGQLGFEFSAEAPYVDMPSLLPLGKLYSGTNLTPKVTSIAAGGVNSYLTVDATRLLGPGEDPSQVHTLGRVQADVWSMGQGIKGMLGNGRWTHIQGSPTKIPSLSGLFEYDETTNKTVPIRMAKLSIGSNHASAIMDNITFLDTNEKSTDDTTNWGADVVWWGNNEYYQLGTGKRNSVATPIYIRPLDMESEVAAGRKEEHRFHVTPRHNVTLAGGKKVSMEQRIECGRGVTAVYSGI